MMGQALPAAGSALDMEWIEVSPEMTAVIGRGAIEGMPMPHNPILLQFALGGPDGQSAIRIGGRRASCDSNLLLLFVARAAWLRLGGRTPSEDDRHGYHLTTELRQIARALCDCAMTGEARTVYRLAKSIELLCETVRAQRDDALVPLAGGRLSVADTHRLMAARRMIDERWCEKLTLDLIARGCGLNRAKLTSGFRDVFGCTIAEALAERRLCEASRMLLTTDRPVSSIGYANGYLNNASFARAFGRRFGVTPSGYRACAVTA